MKKIKMGRFAAVLALVLCTAMLFSSCGLSKLMGERNITILVRGNLDENYLGEFDEDYLELIDSTKEDAEATYLESMATSADYFAYYWGIIGQYESIEDLEPELQTALIELMKEIYSHAKYEVKTADLQSDGVYNVKIVIDPIDINARADELYESGTYEPLETFFEKTENLDFDNMSDDEYWKFSNEYGWIIVEMFESLIPNLGYGEQKSMIMQVGEIDGYFQISDDDFSLFDSYVLTY
ncbi:MAG: hypothetical protein IJX55_03390 [Clostridia bacterium]|nr:hypothetical protein [Clostridia bacterium]